MTKRYMRTYYQICDPYELATCTLTNAHCSSDDCTRCVFAGEAFRQELERERNKGEGGMRMNDGMLDIVKDTRNLMIALRNDLDDISYWLIEAAAMDGAGERYPIDDRVRVQRMLSIMQTASTEVTETLYRVMKEMEGR